MDGKISAYPAGRAAPVPSARLEWMELLWIGPPPLGGRDSCGSACSPQLGSLPGALREPWAVGTGADVAC